MSKDIEALEKQLREAREQESREARQRELDTLKEKYEGKAFGNRSFERNARSASDSLVYIHGLYLGTSSSSGQSGILGNIWRVDINRQGKGYRFSRDHYSYSRRKDQEYQLSSEDRNAFSAIYDLLSYNKKEIPVETFMKIWSAAETHESVLTEAFKKEMGGYTELIRMGDSSDEDRIQKAIGSMKLDILDIQALYPKLWEEIKYCQLPMFQNQRWIPRLYVREVLNYQILLWQAEIARSYWDTRGNEYTRRRIETVSSFFDQF